MQKVKIIPVVNIAIGKIISAYISKHGVQCSSLYLNAAECKNSHFGHGWNAFKQKDIILPNMVGVRGTRGITQAVDKCMLVAKRKKNS